MTCGGYVCRNAYNHWPILVAMFCLFYVAILPVHGHDPSSVRISHSYAIKTTNIPDPYSRNNSSNSKNSDNSISSSSSIHNNPQLVGNTNTRNANDRSYINKVYTRPNFSKITSQDAVTDPLYFAKRNKPKKTTTKYSPKDPITTTPKSVEANNHNKGNVNPFMAFLSTLHSLTAATRAPSKYKTTKDKPSKTKKQKKKKGSKKGSKSSSANKSSTTTSTTTSPHTYHKNHAKTHRKEVAMMMSESIARPIISHSAPNINFDQVTPKVIVPSEIDPTPLAKIAKLTNKDKMRINSTVKPKTKQFKQPTTNGTQARSTNHHRPSLISLDDGGKNQTATNTNNNNNSSAVNNNNLRKEGRSDFSSYAFDKTETKESNVNIPSGFKFPEEDLYTQNTFHDDFLYPDELEISGMTGPSYGLGEPVRTLTPIQSSSQYSKYPVGFQYEEASKPLYHGNGHAVNHKYPYDLHNSGMINMNGYPNSHNVGSHYYGSGPAILMQNANSASVKTPLFSSGISQSSGSENTIDSSGQPTHVASEKIGLGFMSGFSLFYKEYKLLVWSGTLIVISLALLSLLVYLYVNNPPTEVVTARDFVTIGGLLTNPQILVFLDRLMKERGVGKYRKRRKMGKNKRVGSMEKSE